MLAGFNEILNIFYQIEFEFISLSPKYIQNKYPRDLGSLIDVLSSYQDYDCTIIVCDFDKTDVLEGIDYRLSPNTSEIHSILVMEKPPKGINHGVASRRSVNIYLNESTKFGLDDKWQRFLIIKELLHSIIYEEIETSINNDGSIHINVSKFNPIEELRIFDFDNAKSNIHLDIENCSEFFTIGLLYPFFHAEIHQKEIANLTSENAKSDLAFRISEYYKIPQFYIEHLLSWRGLGDFSSNLAELHRADGVGRFVNFDDAGSKNLNLIKNLLGLGYVVRNSVPENSTNADSSEKSRRTRTYSRAREL